MAGVLQAMHWTGGMVGGTQWIVSCMIAAGLGVGAFFDVASTLFIAYNRASMRLDAETWLRNNCKEPVFYSQMRAHTTVCAEVEANARVGAFWTAMREVSDGARESMRPLVLPIAGLVVVFILLMLAVPLCCLCSQRLAVVNSRRLRVLPMHQQTMCIKEA
jgi:hypothetical protein